MVRDLGVSASTIVEDGSCCPTCSPEYWSAPAVNAARLLRRLPAGARADLLSVLTTPSNVRADVIRQFHERGDAGMAEALIDLEADDFARAQVVDALRQTAGP
jgi:hypothetical protein